VQRYKNKNERVWYDPDLLSAPVKQCTSAPYWYLQNRVIGSAKGRGTTWFVQLETLQGALRHYRRGGIFGKIVKDQYWFKNWQQTRSYQEFTLLTQLRLAGVHVPKPIAASAVKRGLFYRADLLSEKVPNARDLVDILQEKPLSQALYYNIGREIRKMHDTGVNHTDLNIHNILVDEEQKVWIIDFDKCCVQEGDNWKWSNIDRLKRSFMKEQKKRNIQWTMAEWPSLMKGYNADVSNSEQ